MDFLFVKKNESGFVLVTALLFLVILTLLGVAATNTTTIELMITGNERVEKQIFYKADGGTELGSWLIEENVACASGFTPTTGNIAELTGLTVTSLDLSRPNIMGVLPSDNPATAYPSPTNRVAYVPADAVALANTNFIIGGVPGPTEGAGLAMNAGYLGLGYSAAGGGTHLNYELYSQNIGPGTSEATLAIRWRHMIGMEGECNY